MKKLVLFIVMIGFLTTSIFASVKHCKKTDAIIRMNSTFLLAQKNTGAENSHALPVEKGDVCTTFIPIFNPQKFKPLSPPTPVVVTFFPLNILFSPQHFTAPLYAPPKAFSVAI